MIRLLVALAFAGGLGAIGFGMLRGFVGRQPTAELDEPEIVPEDRRVIFSCTGCGTEVLLLVKGSELPPRHCGEKMLETEEVPNT